jgi:Sec-independent protein secretion pathway component TatC
MDFPLFLFLIPVCLLFSFISNQKAPLNIILPGYFCALLIVECVCYYLKITDQNNLWIYNCWFPVEFAVYSYWVGSYINNKVLAEKIIYFAISYLIIVVIIYSFATTLYQFNTLSFQLGIILLLPILLFKLYEFISGSIIESPTNNPLFWLIIALLLSYLGSFFQFSLKNYLQYNHAGLTNLLNTFNILITNIQYSLIIVYFIISWRKKKLHT